MDNLLYFGINAPRPHQRIITKLSAELYILFKNRQIAFEPLSETMIDSEQTSEVPDVMLVDKQDNTVLLIEVTTGRSLKKDIRKLNELLNDYEVKEGFAYDYPQKKWYKFVNGKGEIQENPSFSDLLNYDLDRLLD